MSDENNGRGGNRDAENSAKKGFSRILEDVSSQKSDDISFCVSGYTKDAKAFYQIYQTRDYSYVF